MMGEATGLQMGTTEAGGLQLQVRVTVEIPIEAIVSMIGTAVDGKIEAEVAVGMAEIIKSEAVADRLIEAIVQEYGEMVVMAWLDDDMATERMVTHLFEREDGPWFVNQRLTDQGCPREVTDALEAWGREPIRGPGDLAAWTAGTSKRDQFPYERLVDHAGQKIG